MSDPELTPDQESRVRRLLAEARHDEPIPVDVAARLDRVLDGLAQEASRVPPPYVPPVADLAARRRRRVGALLVAAAAVVVAGVAVGQLTGGSDDGSDDSADAPSSAAADTDGGQASDVAPSQAPEASSSAPTPNSAVPSGSPDSAGRAPSVSTRHFGRDAARYQPLSEAGTGTDLNDPDFVCEPADWGPGRLVPVRVGGQPAVLAYRPASGDSQVVDLLQCGSGDVLRSTTLPFR